MPFARLMGATPSYILRREEAASERMEKLSLKAARKQNNAQFLKVQQSGLKRRETIQVSQQGRTRSAPVQPKTVQLPPMGSTEVQALVSQMRAQPKLALSAQTLNMSRDTAIGLLSGV